MSTQQLSFVAVNASADDTWKALRAILGREVVIGEGKVVLTSARPDLTLVEIFQEDRTDDELFFSTYGEDLGGALARRAAARSWAVQVGHLFDGSVTTVLAFDGHGRLRWESESDDEEEEAFEAGAHRLEKDLGFEPGGLLDLDDVELVGDLPRRTEPMPAPAGAASGEERG
jgi:hypothetical protein